MDDSDNTVDSGVEEGRPSPDGEGGGLDIGERVARIEARMEFLATRDDLRQLEARLENFATHDDLRQLEVRLEARLEAKFEAMLDAKLANLATRDELHELEVRLNEKISALRDDLKGEMSALRQEMHKLMVFIVGVLATALVSFGGIVFSALF